MKKSILTTLCLMFTVSLFYISGVQAFSSAPYNVNVNSLNSNIVYDSSGINSISVNGNITSSEGPIGSISLWASDNGNFWHALSNTGTPGMETFEIMLDSTGNFNFVADDLGFAGWTYDYYSSDWVSLTEYQYLSLNDIVENLGFFIDYDESFTQYPVQTTDFPYYFTLADGACYEHDFGYSDEIYPTSQAYPSFEFNKSYGGEHPQVPEPCTLLLLGSTLFGMGIVRGRKR